MPDKEVIVVGAGPVGLALAIELGQRGVETLVLERNCTPSLIPKGQNLTQRTLEHFHFWKAEQALRAAHTIPSSFEISGVTAYVALLSGIHYDWLQRDHVNQFYYTSNGRLPQYAVEQVLRERLAELPTVALLGGREVEAIQQDEGGVAVTARADGRGEAQLFHGHYLVGCDGSSSRVGEAASITQTLDDHNRLMALLLFRSNELHECLLGRFPGKFYFNVLNPALDGYWQFFGRVDLEGHFFFHAPMPTEEKEGGLDFASLLQSIIGAPCAMEIDYTGFWDWRFAIADRYRNGRIFIAGDACRSHPPYGGYGVNSGLENVRNLGWKLAAHCRGWAGCRLLDSYDAERRPVFISTARDFIAVSIERDRQFPGAFAPDQDMVAFRREWSRRAAGAKDEVDQFAPHYEGSPVIAGSIGRGCSAIGEHRHEARGHHLSPQDLISGRNVFASLDQWFTLLTPDRVYGRQWLEAARQRSPGRRDRRGRPIWSGAHTRASRPVRRLERQ